MSQLCVILYDQLSLNLSSLQAIDTKKDTVLLCEDWAMMTALKHHQKKLVFSFYLLHRESWMSSTISESCRLMKNDSF